MNIQTSLALVLTLWSCGSPPPAQTPAPPGPAPVATAPPVAPAERPTPLDPQIRRTTLPNGLTVYVMKHAKPEQRAALWLAVDAGSVLEDDDQRGLAHFVEHMAFNGTKRFAKSAIVDYIEKIGMRFGPDVNAYTSFDQTVYQLTVPTDDQKVMLTGLDILRDWAGDVSFDPVEVDKERGVVLEEWRLGRGAWARIDDKQFPILFQGSRYANRLPIGLPETLKHAPRDTLVRFYKDWYRPENMAVMAVGDFDPDAMLREITARFGDLVPNAQRRQRTPTPMPVDHPTAITIATDPEMPYSIVAVHDKMAHRSERTRSDYRRSIVEALYHQMLGARFQELALDPATPFTSAFSGTNSWVRAVDGFTRRAIAKQGKTAEAVGALFREIERVEQHGFLQGELDRARAAQLAGSERSAAEWSKAPSDEIVDEMTRHFLEQEQMPGRHVELEINREYLPTITLAELNHLAKTWGGERGRVITVSGPASQKLPSEAEIRAIVTAAGGAVVEPWRDQPVRPLLAKLPAPGKIVDTKHDAAADATTWTLANGVRVVVKPTTFQNDEVRIAGWQPGGTSLVDDELHARFAGQVVASGGAGELDAVALAKALSGKVARINVGMFELAENVYGSARPADLETALQLLHLKLTAPRRDVRAFEAWRAEQTEWVRNHRLDPEDMFYEDMEAIRTNNHPRRQPTTPEMLAKVDLDKAHAVWRQRFADLGNFTFTFVGNVDLAKLAPLVETYLGSLPSAGHKQKWKDIGIKYPVGKVAKTIAAGSEPKSYVQMAFSAPDKWSREADHDAKVLRMILDIRLREVMREDMGGVYGTRVWVAMTREPTQRREVWISFGCDPANVEKLQQAVYAVVRAIKKDGIGKDYLEKVTEQLKRARETDAKENWWWSNQLRTMLWFGEPFEDVTDMTGILARVTSDRVRASAKRFLDEQHSVTGVLRPAAVAPAAPAAAPAAKPR